MEVVFIRIWEKYGRTLVLTLLVLTILLLMATPIVELPLLVSNNYNEGWNAFQAERAFSDEPLYPAMTALTSTNYPPLGFYIVGALGGFIEDNIVAGRAIAFISLLVTGLGIGFILYRLSGSASLGLFTGLLFLSYIGTHHPTYVGMNDPQWLAHAIMTAGFLIFLAGGRQGGKLILVNVLMFFAGMVKHNLIPLPLAITLWLFLYHRRAIYLWLVSSMILTASCMTAIYLLYGSNFFVGLLRAPREYQLGGIADGLNELVPLPLFLAAGMILLALDRDNRDTRLIPFYVVISGIWGIFIFGGEGVESNAIFDLIIGLVIAAGLLLHQIDERFAGKILTRRGIQTAVMFVYSLTVLPAAPRTLGDMKQSFLNLDKTQASVAADIAFIAAQDGPVLCENLELCYWAGKPFEVDVFNLGQKLKTGVLNENEFTDLWDRRHFAVIQIEDEQGRTYRLPDSTNDHLLRTYEIRRSSDASGVFLVPAIELTLL